MTKMEDNFCVKIAGLVMSGLCLHITLGEQKFNDMIFHSRNDHSEW